MNVNIDMISKTLNIVEPERKPKEERIFVKSNKKSGKKIELKNLDLIKLIEESGELDEWTQNKLCQIKNETFKNNVFDYVEKKLVSSVRLVKTSKLGRKLTPIVWEYYKNRANLDINQVIKQYGRENLIINYSIPPNQNKKKNLLIDLSELNGENKINEIEQMEDIK
jgi:hypothetical protein